MAQQTETTPQRYMGQVKWFNNKAGYGFITTRLDGQDDKDIFAHYTTIQVNNTQYKYLVQGEYVEFELSNSVSDTHEYQATQITGIKSGRLMCETRQLNRRAPREDGEARGPPPPTRPLAAASRSMLVTMRGPTRLVGVLLVFTSPPIPKS